ncbi:MAG: leucine-rich repeat domain-containing protein, partial [Clostridia bacterium]|nr:leucine-rich repeat domain-containing protein [Clostridia bacterium]
MKQCLALLLALLLMLTAAFATADEIPDESSILPQWLVETTPAGKPTGIASGDFEYLLLEDGTVSIVAYNGKEKDLTLPDTLDGYAVSTIGAKAFSGNGKTTELTLPESITCIEDAAFASCRKLTAVHLPDSLQQLGANPFVNCAKLTDFHLSEEHPCLKVVDGALIDYAQQRIICYPSALEAASFTVPDGIASIGEDAFAGASALQE